MGESCAPSADLTFDDRPPQGGTLVMRASDPPTLDPHLMGDVTSSRVGGEIYGGLVTLSLDYQPVLDLAETCSISEDGLVYTFVLRENAKFHDGKPVTAHDFKWSIERAADPDTLSHTAETYLGDIIGVVDKLEGRANEISGVRAVDDRTIEFTIDAPKSYFLAKLSYPTAYVIDQEQVTNDGSWLDEPNGTGPFKLGTYEIGETIILERNDLYHLGPPHIEEVRMILSGGSAMIMYENDEIHLTGVGIDDLPRLLDPSDALHPQLHRSPQDFDVFYVGLNVDQPPFDDVKVRQAMNYAIDLESIAENVLDGRVAPATGVIPPGFPSHTENLRTYHYNPDLARELMQESKYADAVASGDFPRITLTISGQLWSGGTHVPGSDPGTVAAGAGDRNRDSTDGMGDIPAGRERAEVPDVHPGMGGGLPRPAEFPGRAVALGRARATTPTTAIRRLTGCWKRRGRNGTRPAVSRCTTRSSR